MFYDFFYLLQRADISLLSNNMLMSDLEALHTKMVYFIIFNQMTGAEVDPS